MTIKPTLPKGFNAISCPNKGQTSCFLKSFKKGPISSALIIYQENKPVSLKYELNIADDIEEDITSEFIIR